MTEAPAFKGPGHWRSQAAGARHPDTPFAHLAEYARLLQDGGEGTAQALVHRAEAQLKAGDPADAADLLRQAAGQTGHDNAHLADGLREVAAQLAQAPAEGEGTPDEDPGLVPHLED